MKNLIRTITLMLIISAVFVLTSFAGTEQIVQERVPVASVGGNMSVSFKYTPYTDEENVQAKLLVEDTDYDPDTPDYTCPFEIVNGEDVVIDVGSVKEDKARNIVFAMKVRKDIPAAYYNVPVEIWVNGTFRAEKTLLVYVKAASTDKKETDDFDHVVFSLGQGQMTPYAQYPEIMNFNLNMANIGTLGAIDVTASLKMSKSDDEFPFDINEANYDRYFNLIVPGDTVQLPYSFAIRENAYTGFYPITLTITYREATGGELKSVDKIFYVHVKNKEKVDEQSNFNANDRVKARLVVDSYRTEPEIIYAGQEFSLYVNMKNASQNVDASNILFTFESEKVSDSSVFSNERGANSVVVNSLTSGQNQEICMKFIAKAGIDQRSYSMKINEKYDSPEFKNAEETVVIDIPIHQVAKLNIGSIEILPETLEVGDESNIMFPVNNTGKVILYNVMARFEGAGIQTSESYVGNIKPGETGNVDAMVKGVAADDTGIITMTISYEDENGNVSEQTKEIILYVSEPLSEDFDMPVDVPAEPEEKPFYTKTWFYIVLGVIVIGAIAAFIIIKKKKAIKEAENTEDSEEDTDDNEIQ